MTTEPKSKDDTEIKGMDPLVKNILTSALLAIATGVAVWFAHTGIISKDDQSVVVNAIVALVSGLAAAGVGWYKAKQSTPTALIKAVNDSPNGVKVVPASSTIAAVNAPIVKSKP